MLPQLSGELSAMRPAPWVEGKLMFDPKNPKMPYEADREQAPVYTIHYSVAEHAMTMTRFDEITDFDLKAMSEDITQSIRERVHLATTYTTNVAPKPMNIDKMMAAWSQMLADHFERDVKLLLTAFQAGVRVEVAISPYLVSSDPPRLLTGTASGDWLIVPHSMSNALDEARNRFQAQRDEAQTSQDHQPTEGHV